MSIHTTIFQEPVPYLEALRLQEELLARRQADAIPDTLLVLEHPPVITLGIRARPEHLLLSREALARKGIELHETPRGGDVTYHAPGQIVLYPIIKLSGPEADVHAFVNKLEEAAIRTAAELAIPAYRRPGKTGVWTDSGKIAAIGIRFRKWVSSHGMSFNVDLDLAGFDTIVPCGLHGERVASVASILGPRCPALAEVRAILVRHVEQVLSPVTPGPGHRH